MQFLAPSMLWALAALAVPIVLHLWRRRRVVELPFSTLRYLRAAASRTRRRARLENLLLLLLRAAIFALLALAAARPAASDRALHGLGGNVARTVVLILDDSLSMAYRADGRPRLDTARAEVLRVIDALRPGDEAAVFAADDRAQPLVAQPTLDRAVTRRAIQDVQPGQGSSNFAPVLTEARKLLAASTKPVREIYLFTDDQATGWRFDPAVVFNNAWKAADIHLVVVKPDDVSGSNAAVTAVKITSPLVTAGARVTGVATVENHSDAPLYDLLQIQMTDATAARVPVEAAPNSTADVPFEFPMPPAAMRGRIARGEARLQGDNLPADDRFFFTVPIHQTPRVAVFEGQSDGPERVHSGFYLRRALAAGATGEMPPAFPAAALDETPLAVYSAVFLADPARLSDRAAARLDAYARAGGTIVLFPGEATDLPALARADFLPATPIRVRDLPAGRLASQILAPDHPLFANTWGPDTPFPPLPQRRLVEWQDKGRRLRVLVLAGGSEGFVMTGDDGAGRVFIVNASPDRAWGDFPLSPAFLPLVQQIALQSSEGGRSQESFTVGQPIPNSPLLPEDRDLTILLPDNTTRSVPPGERPFLLDRAAQAGFHTVGTSADPALLTFAVNVDPRESDLAPISEDALTRLTPHETVPDPERLRVWLTQRRGMVPLWPWLLLALAAAFAVEAALANLAARRRAQGNATHIRTGRLNRHRIGQPFRAPPEEANAPA